MQHHLSRWKSFASRLLRRSASAEPLKGRTDGFAAWQIFNAPSPRRDRLIAEGARHLPQDVLFSIILSAGDMVPQDLRSLIASIAQQSYRKFELVLVETVGFRADSPQDLPALPEGALRHVAAEAAGAVAINRGAEAARGDFLLCIEAPGRLTEHALLALAAYLQRNPATDLVYADDALDAGGGLTDPRFKPDWSPELLLTSAYTGPLHAIRTTLFQDSGGCRAEFNGAHLYDLVLRAGEKARSVGRVPQLLFVRTRPRVGPSADLAETARQSVVAEAFGRRGMSVPVMSANGLARRPFPAEVPVMPDDGPSVAILIATRNNRDVLERLLASLQATTYRNYGITVVDNMSDEPETVAYLGSLPHRVLHIPNPGGSFSYAYLNNRAAEETEADLLLFLNDDMEVLNPRWLSQMVGWSRLLRVGAVGARLLFPDGRVQHGGVVLTLRRGLTAFRGLQASDPGYLGLAKTTRNCSAVTAACMLTPRALFLAHGGFDETDFPVSYNDVDYCVRLNDASYRVVYCADAELHHYQGYSRGKGSTTTAERAALLRRYGGRQDPFYSPHLSRDGYDFAIKPCVVPPLPLGRPLKVLFVIPSFAGTPSGSRLLALISGLVREAMVQASIVAPDDGPLRAQYTAVCGEVRVIAPTTQRAAAGALIDSGEFDVVCAEGLGCFFAIAAAAERSVPSVSLIHDENPHLRRPSGWSRADVRMATACCSYAYRVLFESEETRRRFARFDRLHNLDLVERSDGPPDTRALAAFREILTSAAFSAVPSIEAGAG